MKNINTMRKIAEKVLFQMEVEKLMNAETGKILDINPAYLSMIKKEDQYDKCPMKAWRKMHVWYHSGQPLRGYDPSKAPEVSDPFSEVPETTPEVKSTGKPKTEEPIALPGPAPTEQPAAPAPVPEFKEEKKTVVIPADIEITQHVFTPEKPKGKPAPKGKGEGKPGTYDKGKPSQEEIDRVLATLGVEIEITLKLKNKQD